MEGHHSDTDHNPFSILGKHLNPEGVFDIFLTGPVEGKSTNTGSFDMNFVKILLSDPTYGETKQNIHKAIEDGHFSGLDIENHIKRIFGAQNGYELDTELESQETSSPSLLRWLLIGYGSASTRSLFGTSVVRTLELAREVEVEVLGQTVQVESDAVYIRQRVERKSIERLKKYAVVLNYWLVVAGEQLILDKRWGIPRIWSPGQDDRPDGWERSWLEGTLEAMVSQLWGEKVQIERNLVEVGHTADYAIQYSELFDTDEGGEGKVLKFWAQDGRTEWFDPVDERRNPPSETTVFQASQDSQIHPDYYTGPFAVPPLRPSKSFIRKDGGLEEFALQTTSQDTFFGLERHTTTGQSTTSQEPSYRAWTQGVERDIEYHTHPGYDQFAVLPLRLSKSSVQLRRAPYSLSAGQRAALELKPNQSAFFRRQIPVVERNTEKFARENLEDSQFWYSGEKSPASPYTLASPTDVPLPLFHRTPKDTAESNSYTTMSRKPPTQALPAIPQRKADKNESGHNVNTLSASAEERSNLLISNYAAALLAKHKSQSKIIHPVVDEDSDMEGERSPCWCEAKVLCNDKHENTASGKHKIGRNNKTVHIAEKDDTENEAASEEIESPRDIYQNRPYLRIDIADVGEKVAVLDAAELRAMEERNQLDKRSLAEQTRLGMPERDRKLEEELKHSVDLKEELLSKLESDTPLVSKTEAVQAFLDAVEEETGKYQAWTDDLQNAEAGIDGNLTVKRTKEE